MLSFFLMVSAFKMPFYFTNVNELFSEIYRQSLDLRNTNYNLFTSPFFHKQNEHKTHFL